MYNLISGVGVNLPDVTCLVLHFLKVVSLPFQLWLVIAIQFHTYLNGLL